MKLRKLELENFSSYDHLELDLSGIRVASVVGGNGSGKSSILSSILWALFGRDKPGGERDLVRSGQNKVRALLEFELGGELCVIDRSFTLPSEGKKLGTAGLKFTVQGKNVAEGSQNLTEIIARKLGASRELITQSIAIQQGELSSFLESTSADRRDLIQKLLFLDRYVKAAIVAKEQSGSMQAAYNTSQHEISSYEGQLALLVSREEVTIQIGIFNGKISAIEQQMEEIRTRKETLVAEDREYRTVLTQLEDRARGVREMIADRSTEFDQELLQLGSSLRALDTEVQSLPQYQLTIARLEKEIVQAEIITAQMQQFKGKRDVLKRTLADQQQRAALASQTVDSCPLCQSVITAERKQAILRGMKEEEQRVSKELGEIEQFLQSMSQVHAPTQLKAEIEAARRQSSRIETRASTRQEIVDRLAKVQADRERVLQELHGDLDKMGRRVEEVKSKLNTEVDSLTTQFEILKGQRVPLDVQLKQWNDTMTNHNLLNSQIAGCRAVIREGKERVEEAMFVADAVAPAGIPLMILDHYLPVVESRARELLGKMSNGMLNLKLAVVETGAKKGIEVMAGSGEMRLVSTLSGGEKTRVALAIRLAISRMLMETAGTSYNFLILDEPPYLDSEGIDQLIQTISQLQDQFGQVLVVSHHPSLRQAFARTITVEKVDGVSRARVL